MKCVKCRKDHNEPYKMCGKCRMRNRINLKKFELRLKEAGSAKKRYRRLMTQQDLDKRRIKDRQARFLMRQELRAANPLIDRAVEILLNGEGQQT